MYNRYPEVRPPGEAVSASAAQVTCIYVLVDPESTLVGVATANGGAIKAA